MSGLSVSDTEKMIVLLVAFAAIYGLSRWGSRVTNAVPSSPEPPPEPVVHTMPHGQKSWPKIVPINSRAEFERTNEYTEAELEPIRVTNTYFSTFDYLPGPPDPSSFADELFVECYNADTGQRWTASYFVASPNGIRDLLDRERWQYARTGNVILVKRYDTRAIRQAVLEDLITDHKLSKPVEEDTR